MRSAFEVKIDGLTHRSNLDSRYGFIAGDTLQELGLIKLGGGFVFIAWVVLNTAIGQPQPNVPFLRVGGDLFHRYALSYESLGFGGADAVSIVPPDDEFLSEDHRLSSTDVV